MRRLMLTVSMLLASCGPKPPSPSIAPQDLISPDLVRPCGGYVGASPTTIGQLVDAAAAEKHGRLCDERKMRTIGDTLVVGKP